MRLPGFDLFQLSKLTLEEKIKILMQVFSSSGTAYVVNYSEDPQNPMPSHQCSFILEGEKFVDLMSNQNRNLFWRHQNSIHSPSLAGIIFKAENVASKWVGTCEGYGRTVSCTSFNHTIALGGAILKRLGIDITEPNFYEKATNKWNKIETAPFICLLSKKLEELGLSASVRFYVKVYFSRNKLGIKFSLETDYTAVDSDILNPLIKNMELAETAVPTWFKLSNYRTCRLVQTKDLVTLRQTILLNLNDDYELKLNTILPAVKETFVTLGEKIIKHSDRDDTRLLDLNYGEIFQSIPAQSFMISKKEEYLSLSKLLPPYISNSPDFPGWESFLEQLNAKTQIKKILVI